MSKYIFRFCLIIWYELYSDNLVENESVIFLLKMVNMKYCKAEIHELSWFNH